MIKSMTGYGMGSAKMNGKTFTVEIKSVNSRYSDYSVKMPRIYTFLEEPLRKKASERISRGKVDIYVNTQSDGESDITVKLNEPLAKAYYDAVISLGASLDIPHHLCAETFLKIPDVFVAEKAVEDSEAVIAAATEALSSALDEFDSMRIREGEKLVYDLKEHLTFIENAVFEIEKRNPETVKEYRARIEERMREILSAAPYDETRLLTEVAIFSDKINVNEETVRLKSHISQFLTMLDEGGSVGRKIDFLIQEMNREINTIGSKANDINIARIVIDVKAEIEKLREQIQNVE